MLFLPLAEIGRRKPSGEEGIVPHAGTESRLRDQNLSRTIGSNRLMPSIVALKPQLMSAPSTA